MSVPKEHSLTGFDSDFTHTDTDCTDYSSAEDTSFTTDEDEPSCNDLELAACLEPNSVEEKAFSHLNRIAQSPIMRARISPLEEISATQQKSENVNIWIVQLQMILDGRIFTSIGSHMGKKGAKELAAADIRSQLARFCRLQDSKLSIQENGTIFTSKIVKRMEKAQGHLDTLKMLASTVNENDQFLVLDIETWDQQQKQSTRMLEVGTVHGRIQNMWAPNDTDDASHDHIIISEHLDLRNGQYKGSCPDNKMRYNECFGTSRLLTLAETTQDVLQLINNITEAGGRVFLFGHSISGDVAWLHESTGIDVSIFVEVDVAEIQMAIEGRHEKRSLGWLCEEYGVDGENLHNAGNDASCTYLVAKKMLKVLSGDKELV